MGKREYFPELDIIKGIAILMVICGHCTSETIPMPIFDRIVISFHMPLFMMASGFLYSAKGDWYGFFIKKSKRLLLPYFSFSTLAIVLAYVFQSYSRTGNVDVIRMIGSMLIGNNWYWFLYVLFIFMVLFKLIHNKYMMLCIAITSFILSYFLNETNVSFVLERLIYHPFFFLLGFGFRHIYHNCKTLFLKFPFLISISFSVLFIVAELEVVQQFDNKHVAQIIGCFMCWSWAIIISEQKLRIIDDLLSHFGKYSLQYYLNHLRISLHLLYRPAIGVFHNSAFVLLFAFTLRTFLSWIALLVEKRIKWLRPLCGL